MEGSPVWSLVSFHAVPSEANSFGRTGGVATGKRRYAA